MEVRHRGLADRAAVGRRVHMDDVGAERDVHGRRRPRAVCRRKDARVAIAEACADDFAPHDFAQPPILLGGQARRAIEERAGLLGHPETAVIKPRANVLRRASREGELEVVDNSRAVGRDRAQDAVAQHPADERAQTDLQRMRPGEHKKASPGAAGRRNAPRQLAQISRRQSFGQCGDKLAHRGPGVKLARELAAFDLARQRGQRPGARAGRIYWLY